MEFRILGPLEATHEGRTLVLGGRERVLLALLLLSASRVVSSERLADELWRGRPPEEALKALRVHVSRLRRALREIGADGVLATHARGYSVRVDPDALDAARFETLLARGRHQAAEGDHRRAAASLREALSLWRGPALSGVADTGLLQVEAARLEDARLAALEERIDADLAAGRHSELTAELDALTRAHPLRERLWAHRMLALYRAGRQAEALRAYQDLRRLLGEELGIEPGADLSRLETAILRHDLGLDWKPLKEAEAVTTAVPASDLSGAATPGGLPTDVVSGVRGSEGSQAGAAGRCPRCGTANSGTARFCSSCGSALWQTCGSCGSENPVSHRFCAGCGIGLDSAAAAVASGGRRALTEERRWATVLFADLSGFTSLSEDMDPEDLRTLLAGCMSTMAEVVEHFGGIPLRVIGDQLMALFGAPVAHGDDAERAVRAALDLQRCAREQGEAFGGLALRTGVNTGEMMFAPVGPDRDFTVVGDAVNLASRLQSCAPPGGVLVGEETYRATKQSIGYRPVASQDVKGKAEPVPAYLALEALAPGDRTVPGAPIVGRSTELGVAATLWQRVLAERAPHVVTILGPPGIGKTRLAREFSALVEQQGGRTVLGRSLPYGESTGYGAFAQQVKAVAGIFETDPVPLAQAKLKRRLSALLPLAWAEEVASHLLLMTGVGAAAAGPDKGALLLAARRFVESLGREQPTVLVFEDLHWADPSLLDLVESLAGRARESPVLLLALARPQLFEARPGWGGGLTSSTLLELHDLSPADSAELVASLLPGITDPAIVDTLLERGGGNPLFLEELAASLLERAGEPMASLPAGVKAIIAARLDALPVAERQLLLDASVVGKIFWTGALRALGGNGQRTADLDRLEARDLVRRQVSSRIEGDDEFSFKHILIREVAYATLPKAARRSRHGAVARFLEEATGERAAESASLLAHHWREAGDTDRAVDYLLVAAERAAQAWAKGEAISLYGEALNLVPESDAGRRRSIRLRRALLLVQENAYQAAVSELDELIPGLAGREQVEAVVARAFCCFLEDAQAMEATAARAVALAEELGDQELRAAALSVVAGGKLFGGEVAEALAMSEQALAVWPAGCRLSDLALHLGMAGNESYLLGRYGETVDYGRRGFDLGREIHSGDSTLWAGAQLGLGLAGLGRHEEALRHLEQLVALGQQLGTLPIFTAIAMNCWAGVLREMENLEVSRRLNHEAIELAASVPFPLAMVEGKVDLLFADLAEGEVGRAESTWSGLSEEARAMPGVHQWRNIGRLEAARAEISLGAGRLERAADEACCAIEGARRVGRVKYEIACRVILGQALLGMGRYRDAVEHLRRALAAANGLKHPPSQWQAGAALTRALAATGDDDGAQAAAQTVRQSVLRFAAGLSEERRDFFLGAGRVQELVKITG
ncbi:MAG: AAA family ATPase [Actinomycetota bacterium]|nr:AAA family ATPase [Actinomycetota bacterium]